MNLFAELRRRNVIRMAGLYLVGAWLLVQVASTLLPLFGVPDWALRGLVVVLVLGFIPALVIAWIFELTPDGLKRDADVPASQSIAPQTARRMDRILLAVSFVALVYFGFDKFVLAPRREAAIVVTTAQAAKAEVSSQAKQAALANSIAVLPFVNMSGDAENQYFSDGITEELLNVLARVDGLGVASRTSSFAYKDNKTLSTIAIAQALKVGHILEGSVRKSGNRVRITAQLIDAVNDRHLWSETYDRELTDIFKIQDEIANAIVAALRGTLTAKPERSVTVRADTENLQAYEMYLKARELFIARKDLDESVRLFEKVVELDPKFARGWEGLAAVSAVVESWGIRDRDYTALARKAAQQALDLDPGLSMPWAALAMGEQKKLPIDWGKVLELMDKAIAADPKNATAFLWRSIAWDSVGFFDRAIADQDRCLVIDPGYKNCVRWKAQTLLYLGKNDQALALFEQGVAEGFIDNRASDFIPVLAQRGDRLAAELLMAKMGTNPELSKILMTALTEPKAPRPEAKSVVSRYLIGTEGTSDQSVGPRDVYLWLGAYDLMANAAYIDSYNMTSWDRSQPSFRNSPGFKRTLDVLGVPAYWRKHGYPAQCRAQGSNDFICDEIHP